ncbi:MAG: amidohydrolase family protein [Terriglobales bacterium]
MRRMIATMLLLFGCALSLPAQVTAMKAGRLIDVEAGTVLTNQVILIEGGKIKAVGGDVQIPAGAKVIDLSGSTVLPGLIDCHSHLVGDAEDLDPILILRKSAAQVAFDSIPNARVTLEAGFTSVRDVGTYRAFVDVALRDAINRGYIPGPRMYVAGAYVTVSGGAGALTGIATDIGLPYDLRAGIADSPEEVRKRIREIHNQGVDHIKILATGAVLTHGSDPGAEEFTMAELEAAVDEARRHGMKVVAHAHGAQGIKNAVRAGVVSIEHGTFLDDEGIALMKQHGTYLVADVYNDEYIMGEAARKGMPKDFLEKEARMGEVHRQAFRKAVKAGVKIAYGTDSGVYPHGWNAKQFAWMVRYGTTPMQSIQSATIWAADLIGVADQIGSIKPGKYADLIAVSGDPLADVTVLEKVGFVMKEGKVYKQ